MGNPTNRNSALRDTVIVASGTLFSRLLGFVRLALTMYVLVKVINDVFQLANMLPNQVYDLFISSAFSAILVPAIVKAQKSPKKDEFISALFFVGLVGLFVITLLATVFAPFLVYLFGYQLPADWNWVAVGIAFWCMPQVFFYGAHSLLGQYLNANGRFVGYAWSPAANNLVGIVGLLVFHWVYSKNSPAGQALLDPANWDGSAIALIGGPATLGIVVQAALLIWPARQCGLRFVWPIKIRGVGLGKTLAEGLWATAIVAATQIKVIAISNVAGSAFAWSVKTGIPVPSYTERTVASLFYALPMSVMILSVVNVLFPRIVQALVDGETGKVKTLSLGFHRYVGPITVFSVVVLATASIPLSEALTLVSNYDPILVAIAIVAMSPALIPLGTLMLNQRLLFAEGRTKMVLFAAIPAALLTALFCVISVHTLPAKYWLAGALFGDFISTVVFSIFLHYAITLEVRNDIWDEVAHYVRPVLGGIVTGAVGLGFLYLVGFHSRNFLDLTWRGLALVALEFALFWIVGMSKDTRQAMVRLVRR